jgi:hypothetical protein
MKRKLLFLNLFFGCALLFSIAFHSIHGIEHLVAHYSEVKCIHTIDHSKTDLNHSHDSEECFVCEFVFSIYQVPTNYILLEAFEPSFYATSTSFFDTTTFSSFTGWYFSRRGPPIV